MTVKEFNEKIADKCKDCKKWLYCKRHQKMWFKKVDQSPTKIKHDEHSTKAIEVLSKLFQGGK